MAQKKFKKPLRPKVWRLPPPRVPKWLLLEPMRLGSLAGMGAAVFSLLVSFVRQQGGAALSPLGVFYGAVASFVAGYAAVGLFVLLLLHIIEREIPEEEAYISIATLRGERAGKTERAPKPPEEEITEISPEEALAIPDEEPQE